MHPCRMSNQPIAVINDLHSSLLPAALRREPGESFEELMTACTPCDFEAFLSAVSLRDMIAFDWQAMDQFMSLRRFVAGMRGERANRIPEAGALFDMFMREAARQQAEAYTKRGGSDGARCNAVLMWGPTRRLLLRLAQELPYFRTAHIASFRRDGVDTMNGMTIIGTDSPGIRAAWIPDLDLDRTPSIRGEGF